MGGSRAGPGCPVGEGLFYLKEDFSMLQKKFFLVGMTALLGVSLFLIGCPTETEEKTVTVTVPEIIHLDADAKDVDELKDLLAEKGDLSIGLTGTVKLTADLTVPDKKVVYILPSAELDVDAKNLTVDGIVYVGGTLKAGGNGVVKIPGSGRVGVVKGGTLSVKDKDSVNDGAATPATVLKDTSKVGFAADGSLVFSGLADAAAIVAAFEYAPHGTLEVTTTLTPAQIIAIEVPAGKKLAATTSADVTISADATLTVPANVAITTTGKITGNVLDLLL